MSNKIISMPAAPRPIRNALEEFLPELDPQRNAHDNQVDPREIHLEPVGLGSESVVTATSAPADNPAQVQLWPMLAAALVGIGVTLLGFAAYSRFEGL